MIALEPHDIKVSCLNISDNQLPEKMVQDIRGTSPSFIDPDKGLAEDMYSTDTLRDELETDEWDSNLDEIEELLSKHECCYFRIIKTGKNVH